MKKEQKISWCFYRKRESKLSFFLFSFSKWLEITRAFCFNSCIHYFYLWENFSYLLCQFKINYKCKTHHAVNTYSTRETNYTLKIDNGQLGEVIDKLTLLTITEQILEKYIIVRNRNNVLEFFSVMSVSKVDQKQLIKVHKRV